jgi:redox-sensitive bicupin YhaK (pirin superfamily)
VRLWRAQPGQGGNLSLVIGAGSLGWLQVISGEASVRGQAGDLPLRQGDGLGLASGALDQLVAGEQGADLLLFDLGQPAR